MDLPSCALDRLMYGETTRSMKQKKEKKKKKTKPQNIHRIDFTLVQSKGKLSHFFLCVSVAEGGGNKNVYED